MIDGTKFNKDARQCREAGRYCGPTAKWFEGKEKPIPKCVDCKWLSGGTSECLKKSVNPRTGFEVYNCTNADFSRRCEQLCDKYGKWWEKKELSPGQLLEINPILKGGKMFGFTVIDDTDKFVKLQKEIRDGMEKERFHGRQSWLCRLICGHHGRLNDKR
jgi:hypothetical protein